MSKDINIGAISEALNNKADLDLGNVVSGVDYVIEYATGGGDNPWWYRKYKSGWVEQGGYCVRNDNENPRIVNLPKEMSNNRYTILFGDSNLAMPNPTGQSRIVKIYSQDITNFKTTGVFDNGSNTDYEFYWEVKGWAAENS